MSKLISAVTEMITSNSSAKSLAEGFNSFHLNRAISMRY